MTITKTPEETKQLAREIAKKLPHKLICLFGEIGSGKTTFTKGFLKQFVENPDKVKSPTYTYIRRYQGKKIIYHLDLYRIEGQDQLLIEEIHEILEQKDSIVIVEWAEKLKDQLPESRMNIHFEYIDENSRKIEIT